MRSLLMLLAWLLAAPTLAPAQQTAGPDSETFTARPATRAVSLIGFTRARRVLDLVSEEDGRVARVAVDVGQTVGGDGVFARLDTTFIDLELAANKTDQKRLDNDIDFYARDEQRFRELVRRETAAQTSLDEMRHKLVQARLGLEKLKVEARNLAERRERHVIAAPQGWQVLSREIEPGEWVAKGQTVGRVGDYRTLLVPFALTTTEYNALRAVQDLCLVLPETPTQGEVCIPARIERISPEFDPETRKIGVDLAVDQGLDERRGGLRAELELELPDPSGAVSIPATALVQRYEEFFVRTPQGEELRVQVLAREDGRARVRGFGVEPGTVLLTDPSR